MQLIFFTLNIFYCQAIVQTLDQTQVINLWGLLRAAYWFPNKLGSKINHLDDLENLMLYNRLALSVGTIKFNLCIDT